MKAILRWWCCYVFFISWGKWWKGVYIHFLPKYTVRLFLWGWDVRPKDVAHAAGMPRNQDNVKRFSV